MADLESTPHGVHLVGSIPLEDNEHVFRFIGDRLGDYLHRIPDGETGERKNWLDWQYDKLKACDQLIEMDPNAATAPPQFRLEDGVAAYDIDLPDLGYADAALASWKVFDRFVETGVIPETCRFQVSLPTPRATAATYLRPDDRDRFEIAYGEQLASEIADIIEPIPPQRLAIQWDVSVEFALLEGAWPTSLDDVEDEIDTRLATLARHVPEPVELGYHLCYGGAVHRQFPEPEDTGEMVRVADAILDAVDRSLQWLHLPVPRERTDREYVEPLADLDRPAETELYVGLVHQADGVEGSRRRIMAANSVVDDFGIATECGWDRYNTDTLDELVAVHTELANPVR